MVLSNPWTVATVVRFHPSIAVSVLCSRIEHIINTYMNFYKERNMKKVCAKCKEPKLFTEFNKDKNRKDGLQPRCKDCRKKHHKKTYDDSNLKTRNSINSKERRRRWRLVLIEIKKSSRCINCNNNDYRVIEFHHRDPDKKEFTISKYISYYGFNDNNLKTLLTEIDKCDTLCANCHRILHWEESYLG